MIASVSRNLLATTAVVAFLLTSTVVPAEPQKAAEGPVEVKKAEAKPEKDAAATAAAARAAEKVAAARAAARVVIRKNAVAVAEPVIDKAQKDAMMDQVLRQMRPILRAELHLIRNTCKPSQEEMAKLAKEGENVLKDVGGKVAEAQLKMQQGIGVQSMPNAIEEIQRTLATAVKTNLTLEQAARYQTEVDARTKSEREVAARMLVARFDPVLNLSVEQRGKIADALAKSNNAMCKSLDNLMYANGYLPAVDDNDVVPFLDDRQKTLWRETQRVHFGVGFNYGITGLNLNDDDLAEEDDPAAASELAKKRAAANPAGALGGILRGFIMGGAVRQVAPAPAAPVQIEKRAVKAAPAEKPDMNKMPGFKKMQEKLKADKKIK
jgi:hypothetical protein